jgi:hypothetical protein
MRTEHGTALITALLIVSAFTAYGQSSTASLRGVVTDPTQAVVPRATVIVTDVLRNLRFSSVTDEAGRYLFPQLQPSRYQLRVEAPGFETAVVSDFVLQVAQEATINVMLRLGTPTTTVEVTGTQPLLNLTSAALGQAVENRYVASIPLIDREFMRLAFLAPGILPPDNDPGLANMSNPTRFVSNGVRAGTSDVFVDGGLVSSIEQGNAAGKFLELRPAIETVQEFKVQTNFFSAEFGNTGGAVVNIVSKSGSNQFHGVAYEYHRRDAFNANSFFAKRSGSVVVPNFSYHKYGGAVGGPVVLPRLYNGKNRTFFYSSLDIENNEGARTAFLTVPTARERAGDFSDTRQANGQLYVIYNPFDTYRDAQGQLLRRPFPGNIIPASMQDPVARKLMSYFPQPTSEGQPFTRVNNVFAQGSELSTQHQTITRMDHFFSDKQRIYGRFAAERSHPWGKPFRPYGPDSPAEVETPWLSHTKNFSVELSRTHSPNLILSARYNLSRQTVENEVLGKGFDPTSLGLPAVVLSNGIKRFPTFTFEGYSQLGTYGSRGTYRAQTTDSFAYSATQIVSGHTIKAGGESRYYKLNATPVNCPTGCYSFSRRPTGENPLIASATQGNAIASALLGWLTGGSYGISERPASLSQYHGWYIQDDWRLTARLTLNLGLRYDFEIPRTERYDRYTWFDPEAPSPIDGKVPGFRLRGALRFTGPEARSPFDRDMNNLQPRVGLAYGINDKTTVRAGYGIYYTVTKTIATIAFGPPFAVTTPVLWSLDGGITQYATFSNPFPDGLIYPAGKALGAATFLGQSLSTASRENRTPKIQQWAFSIQRELPSLSLLEINYTGTRGTQLYFPDLENQNRLDRSYWSLGRAELNRLVPNPFRGVITDPTSPLSAPAVTLRQLLRPYPQYTGLFLNTPTIGNSIYHGLQVKFEKRMTRGLSAIAHYTWAKLIDDSSNSGYDFFGGDSQVQNIWNLQLERALSVTDIAHRAVLTLVCELPFGRKRVWGTSWNRAMDAVLGGWNVSGVITLQGGFPIVIGMTGANLLEGVQRPDLIGDPSRPGSVRERLDGYINPNAFSRPPADVFGSAPRTLSYRHPGVRNADLTLGKTFYLWEGHRAEFRLEAFNAFNGVVFGKANSSFGSNAFGLISSYAGGFGPRQLQIAVRYEF